MDVGIGIPNTVPSATGSDLLEWARRAERAGFSSLAGIGAVSYRDSRSSRSSLRREP